MSYSLLHILNVFFDVLLTSEVYTYSKNSIKATPNSGQSLGNFHAPEEVSPDLDLCTLGRIYEVPYFLTF